jgi:hypothetical protein
MLKKSVSLILVSLLLLIFSSFSLASTNGSKLSVTAEEIRLKSNPRVIRSPLTAQDIAQIHEAAEQKAQALRELVSSITAKVETYLATKLDRQAMLSYHNKIRYLINSKTVPLSNELVRWYIDSYLPQIEDKQLQKAAIQYLGYNTNTGNEVGTLDANTVFNRADAKAYAEQYAENPNTTEYPYYSDGDCANFVSQVLENGGMAEVGTAWDDYNSWFCNTTDESELTKVALTWRAARYFRRHWGNEDGIGRNRAFAYTEMTVAEALENFDSLYYDLWEGDVIQYGDPYNNNYPYHTQVVHDWGYNANIGRVDLFMAQHTRDEKNISLYQYLSSFRDPDKRYIYIYEIKDSY